MKKNIIIAAIIIIVGAGSFFGGMKYQQSKISASSPGNARNFGNLTVEQRQQMINNGARGSLNNSGGFASGEILSKDSNSITLKLIGGGSKIILFSGSTEISKNATGTPDDLVVGKSVTISGTANQDGSVTASSIQLRTLSQGATTTSPNSSPGN